MFRIRIKYRKQQPLRFTGSLDMQRIWERSFRRAGIPLVYTQGFHPQPRIQQAAPLPLGFLGQSELADFWLENIADISNLKLRLDSFSPIGLEVLEIDEVELFQESLPSQVKRGAYVALPLDSLPIDIENRIDLLLLQKSIKRERRSKSYDLKPLLLEISCTSEGIFMVLMLKESATGRPEEVISALELDQFDFIYERTHLYLE